jgi:hypothetical protein
MAPLLSACFSPIHLPLRLEAPMAEFGVVRLV